LVANHLCRIFSEYANDSVEFSDHFPDKQLFVVSQASLPWFAHIMNNLATEKIPLHWSEQEKDKFFSQVRYYYWEDP